MIDLNVLTKYYPPFISENPSLRKYILKEHIQLLLLDYLTTTTFIKKIALIGGTNLRLVKGIDRFSEDLDFDCKSLSEEEFIKMTDDMLTYLKRNGYQAIIRNKESDKHTAFRKNIYFPGLLFNLNLSAYKNERFMIKIEAQDQWINYKTVMTQIKRCGFFFSFPVPPDPVLCAMKISALLSRSKGRDFYDVMFLLDQCDPDYSFLSQRTGVQNKDALITTFNKLLEKTNLKLKARDFEHLVFQERNSKKILMFKEFINL